MQDIIHQLSMLQKETAAFAKRNKQSRDRPVKRPKPAEHEFLEPTEKQILWATYKSFMARIREEANTIARDFIKDGKKVTAKKMWDVLRERGMTKKDDGTFYDFQIFSMYYYKMIRPEVLRLERTIPCRK